MRNKVEITGVNTLELKVLPPEETMMLIKESQNGDYEARDRLVEGNIKLVLSVIKKFNNRGVDLDDLFQVGAMGLIKAIDNFDISLNVQFSTYAVPMIIGEIKRFLRDNSTIRVSRSLKDTAYKAITTRENLMKKNLKEPSITEIAEEIGISKADIVIALEAVTPSISLYEPVFNDGGDTLYVIDQVKDKKNTEDRWVRNIALKEAINRLSPRERQIITLRFFDCRTQTEVAKDLGISQAQVSRLEKCALRDMKRHLC